MANFDLTGPWSENVSGIVSSAIKEMPWSAGAIMALTVLRGRETPQAFSLLKEMAKDLSPAYERLQDDVKAVARHTMGDLSEIDVARVLMVPASIGLAGGFDGNLVIRPIRIGTYRSTAGTQTMLWSAWQLLTVEAIQHFIAEEAIQALFRARRIFETRRSGLSEARRRWMRHFMGCFGALEHWMQWNCWSVLGDSEAAAGSILKMYNSISTALTGKGLKGDDGKDLTARVAYAQGVLKQMQSTCIVCEAVAAKAGEWDPVYERRLRELICRDVTPIDPRRGGRFERETYDR